MASTTLPEYTWDEIAKHNTEDSCWVYLEDEVFDITSFLERHPGGRDMILLMAGRDITNILPTYHPFSDTPLKTLKTYKIGKLKGSSEFGSFTPDTGFYKELREKVGNYFRDNNIDYKDYRPGLIRYIFILSMMYISWYFAWTCNENNDTFNYILNDTCNLAIRHRIYLMIVSGVFQGMLLIHTMHDCSHCAFSHNPLIWKWIGRICLDLTSGNSFDAWLHQHTVGHHVYTNVIAVDPDLPLTYEGDVRRIAPHQSWTRFYMLQYLWLPLLYCVYAFKSRVQDITGTLFGGFNGAMRVNPEFRNNESLIRQMIAKIVWIMKTIFVPIFIFNNSFFYEFLPLFLIMEFTSGYFLSYNFQVSHVSPGVTWPDPVKDEKTGKINIPGEWAKLQVETCVDYAHTSKWCTFWSGALNYQSIHHLFPAVSQYHYPAIRPIILEICKKHGVTFNHVETFSKAFYLHIKQLYDMSFEPNISKKLE